MVVRAAPYSALRRKFVLLRVLSYLCHDHLQRFLGAVISIRNMVSKVASDHETVPKYPVATERAKTGSDDNDASKRGNFIQTFGRYVYIFIGNFVETDNF